MRLLIRNICGIQSVCRLAKALIVCVIGLFVFIDWIDYGRNNAADSVSKCSNYNPVLCSVMVTETQTMSTTALGSVAMIAYFGGRQLAVYRTLTGLFRPRSFIAAQLPQCGIPNRVLVGIHVPAASILIASSLTFAAPIAASVRNTKIVKYAFFETSALTYECMMALLTIGSAFILYLNFAIAMSLFQCFRAATERLNQGFQVVMDGVAAVSDIEVLDVVRHLRKNHRQMLVLYGELEHCLGAAIFTVLFAAVLAVAQTAAGIMQAYNSFADPVYATGIVLKNGFFIWMVLALIMLAERASRESSRTIVAWSELRDRYWDKHYPFGRQSDTSSDLLRRRSSAADYQDERLFQRISMEIAMAISDTKSDHRIFRAWGIMGVNLGLLAQILMLWAMVVFFPWGRKEGYTGSSTVTGSNSTSNKTM